MECFGLFTSISERLIP